MLTLCEEESCKDFKSILNKKKQVFVTESKE